MQENDGGSITRDTLATVIALATVSTVAIPAWPLYALLRVALPRPPVVPSLRRCARIARLAVVAEGPSTRVRAFVLAALLRRMIAAPLSGLAWYLDELLYGRDLDRTAVVAPIVEMSAARSGSTQLARYLEDDPRTCAPSLLQALFPYLWLWRLVAAVGPRLVSREAFSHALLARLPAPYVQRHEADPFRTDTIEVIFSRAHLCDLATQLGAAPVVDDYSTAELTPTNTSFWLDEFVPWLDRVARKTLRFAGPGRRLLLKGHFLAAADAVAARFPDARFLTVVRAPEARLRSLVNFHRHQPGDIGLGEIPWPWLVERAMDIELPYQDRERAWFEATGGPGRRVVVRFTDYLRDLEGTLRHVYRACFDETELPPHLPRAHSPRQRSNYTHDRTLAELGVDLEAFAARTRDYARWCGD